MTCQVKGSVKGPEGYENMNEAMEVVQHCLQSIYRDGPGSVKQKAGLALAAIGQVQLDLAEVQRFSERARSMYERYERIAAERAKQMPPL